jgi:hypothetical protein
MLIVLYVIDGNRPKLLPLFVSFVTTVLPKVLEAPTFLLEAHLFI